MDASFRSRNSSFRLFLKSDFDRGYNMRRRSYSPVKYYHSNFSGSRLNYIELKSRENYIMTASLSRKRSHFEDYNSLHYYSRKCMQYSNDSELCSISRNIHMNSPHQSLDDLLNASVKKIKGMREDLLNSESKDCFSDLKNMNYEKDKTNRGTSKPKIDLTNVSMKHSKNVSCFGKRQVQSLENDSLLFLARKSVKKNRKRKSSNKSKSVKRKSCQDIPTDDTMILCIDEEEVAEILFGNFGPNKSEKDLTNE